MNKIIKAALERRGMTQKELAEAIYVTPQAVSKWISGESRPTLDNAIEIDKVLGINLTAEMARKERKEKTMNYQPQELRKLDSFKKASDEAKLILERANITQNYSHAINELLHWLLSATIALTYNQLITYKKTNEFDEEPDYGWIASNLDDFFQKCARYEGYHNELHYSFFCLGGDLFESFGDSRMPNHEYASAAMDCWYNLEMVFDPDWNSPLFEEFKVALLEVINALN